MKIKKEKNSKEKINNKHHYDKGQIFVKIMAGILALLMIFAAVISLIYALIG